MIATCRRAEAGGLFQGTVEEQVELLAAAVHAGCQQVDLEFESLASGGAALLRRFSPGRVVVSYHDFKQTRPLKGIYRRLARLPVAAIKIATYARCLRDNLQIYRLLKAYRHQRPKLVALAMGPCGIPSRVLAVQWGSWLTYASPGNHAGTASGQLPADYMRNIYRADRLDHRTQLYGVVGSHASISLSPVMQNAAFQAKRVNAVYLPCETKQLADFLALARELKFLGFSVTMPFKRAILRHLDWVDPLAERIGACNTVAVRAGKRLGWNTDAAAVVEVLAKRLRLAGSRMLILGAGGAGRAAAFALRAEGAELLIADGREQVARELARKISAQAVPWEETGNLDVDALINATPVGMAPHTDGIPVDLARLRVRVVFDLVYYPTETRLLHEARGRGLITISGLEMLVAQGARQFEIWTGQTAPRALMEQALRQVLHLSGSS
jgi:3-dehydroquinate dehydratase/shikimate dehydrogenase